MSVIRAIINYTKVGITKLDELFFGGRFFSMNVQRILEKNFPPDSPFSFIQVGANDGVSNDFLFSFITARNPSGLVIEPVTEYYEKLKQNYLPYPAVHPVKKAIHASCKEVVLHKVTSEGLRVLPAWASGITSIDSRHYQKSGIDSAYITTETAPAIPFMSLIKDYGIGGKIDLLQIDVEGYDYEVLKQVDFSIFHPKIIRYEHTNLPEAEAVQSIQYLKSLGYWCFYEGIDVIAVRLNEMKL